MNRIKSSLVAFGLLSLFVAGISLATPRPTRGQGGNQQPLNVNVVNAPLPVTGTVAVGNTVLVSEAPRQPFNHIQNIAIDDGDRVVLSDFFIVPDGKQLVVTYASAIMGLPEGQKITFRINVRSGSQFEAIHELVPFAAGPIVQGGPGAFVASGPVNLYVSSGEVLGCSALRDSSAGFVFGRCNVSGYLVDAP